MGKNELNNLIDLIRVYDAAISLNHLSQQLSGPGLSERSVISELMRVIDVIKRMTPLYDPQVDWEESSVYKLLEDRRITPVERAERLLKV